MKDVVVDAPEPALSVEQILQVLNTTVPLGHGQLHDLELLPVGCRQYGFDVPAKATVGPWPTQWRDIDHNSDFLAPSL